METSVNNKCKAFTSLEQSKKLAEILPTESADMRYTYFGDGQCGRIVQVGKPIELCGGKDIPCWSLAALIDALPLGVDIHNISDGHKMYYYVEIYMKRMDKGIYLSTERHENLVDACVEMILKLHEQKLL